jgi:hypothetical protein
MEIDDLMMGPLGLDDLLSLFIEKLAHCLPIKNPIVNRKSCNRQSSIDPSASARLCLFVYGN